VEQAPTALDERPAIPTSLVCVSRADPNARISLIGAANQALAPKTISIASEDRRTCAGFGVLLRFWPQPERRRPCPGTLTLRIPRGSRPCINQNVARIHTMYFVYTCFLHPDTVEGSLVSGSSEHDLSLCFTLNLSCEAGCPSNANHCDAQGVRISFDFRKNRLPLWCRPDVSSFGIEVEYERLALERGERYLLPPVARTSDFGAYAGLRSMRSPNARFRHLPGGEV